RKNESLGRLGRAEENLTRVSDLLGELRPQVRRLALQAEHQQEHDLLGRRARALVQEGHRRRERGLREVLGDARRREAAGGAAARARDAERLAAEARRREAAADRVAKRERIELELDKTRAELREAEAAAGLARAVAIEGRRIAEGARASLADARAVSDAAHHD